MSKQHTDENPKDLPDRRYQISEGTIRPERRPLPAVPKGMVWAKPRGRGERERPKRKNSRVPIERIASRFVNLPLTAKSPTTLVVTKELHDFWKEHELLLEVRPKALVGLSLKLRLGWQPKYAAYIGRVLESIFYSSTPKPFELTDREPADERRPAFRIEVGSSRPTFKPRDLLDAIAYTIWQASERGLLKTCQGPRCKTPLFVANRKRRLYCYSGCDKVAKRRSKLAWWKRNLSSLAKARAAKWTHRKR